MTTVFSLKSEDLNYRHFRFFEILEKNLYWIVEQPFTRRLMLKKISGTYWAITLQSLRTDKQTDTNSSSTRRNKTRYIKIMVQIEKFVTDADSNMPPSVGWWISLHAYNKEDFFHKSSIKSPLRSQIHLIQQKVFVGKNYNSLFFLHQYSGFVGPYEYVSSSWGFISCRAQKVGISLPSISERQTFILGVLWSSLKNDAIPPFLEPFIL